MGRRFSFIRGRMQASNSHGPGRPISPPGATASQAVASLEASVLLCLAKPGKVAVHRLRTSTRRVEAQLELLSMLPGPSASRAADPQCASVC